jgi:perosamine synthetase
MTGGDLRPTIPGAPTLRAGDLLRPSRKPGLPGALSGGRVSLHHQGRYALWHGLRALGLGPGDAVAMPALHCGVELAALADARVRLIFHEVGESLRVTPQALGRAADQGAKAALVIHYFGLPQPDMAGLRAVCAGRGLALIEDCAHLLTGRAADGAELGSIGDIAIFSPRKILPMPDGGALRLNRPDLAPPPPPTGRQPLTLTARIVAGRLRRGFARRGGRGSGGSAGSDREVGAARRPLPPMAPTAPVPDASGPADTADLYSFRPERLAWGMSRISVRVLRAARLEEVVARRRDNYRLLASALGPRPAPGIRLLDIDWPESACPWVLPVIADDPGRCIAHLRGRGIEIGRFWPFTHPLFPEAEHAADARLKQQLVGMPVHQDLDEADIERIAAAVRSLSA